MSQMSRAVARLAIVAWVCTIGVVPALAVCDESALLDDIRSFRTWPIESRRARPEKWDQCIRTVLQREHYPLTEPERTSQTLALEMFARLAFRWDGGDAIEYAEQHVWKQDESPGVVPAGLLDRWRNSLGASTPKARERSPYYQAYARSLAFVLLERFGRVEPATRSLRQLLSTASPLDDELRRFEGANLQRASELSAAVKRCPSGEAQLQSCWMAGTGIWLNVDNCLLRVCPQVIVCSVGEVAGLPLRLRTALERLSTACTDENWQAAKTAYRSALEEIVQHAAVGSVPKNVRETCQSAVRDGLKAGDEFGAVQHAAEVGPRAGQIREALTRLVRAGERSEAIRRTYTWCAGLGLLDQGRADEAATFAAQAKETFPADRRLDALLRVARWWQEGDAGNTAALPPLQAELREIEEALGLSPGALNVLEGR